MLKITMEMTEEEAREYLEFHKNRNEYRTAQSRVRILCQLVADAIAPCRGETGEYVIVDQDHADDLWNTVQMFK